MSSATASIRDRVRTIRSYCATRFFAPGVPDIEKRELKDCVVAADLAQELMSYPDRYLQNGHVTESRMVETIQRIQESLLGSADVSMPLRVVIECDHAIEVPAERAPKNQSDPLLELIRDRLQGMLDRLSLESPFYAPPISRKSKS